MILELKKVFLLSFLCVFLFASLKCNQREEKLDEQKLKEHLMNANRIMVKNERGQIEEFLTRHNWLMDSTGTGLRYMIYETGAGNKPSMHDSVSLTGKIFLLDATLCADYKKENPMKFLIGRKNVPHGFEEAALLMSEGDKGRFIIPAHLAFGLLGNNDKIPGGMALYAELELAGIKTASKK
jgi:FKBP-type peptidyl-prolyl cis-trans isomerase FkpA